ncbi:hypothetical protein H0H93_007760 [Arthromyces matolae]|nr:hypothetical protein H0H93_007760 [Arthromyces matolae]
MNSRLYLNYRGFHYQTRWLPTVDVKAECISLKIPPSATNPSGEPIYTFPAIIDYTSPGAEPTAVSDSYRILRYLETQYPPSAPIFPLYSEPKWSAFNSFIDERIIIVAGSLFVYELAATKLPEELSYFQSNMEALFKGPWADLRLEGPKRSIALKQLEDNLQASLEYFGDQKEGTYHLGDDITYADFAICAALIWCKSLASQEDWSKISAWKAGRWGDLVKRFSSWTTVTGQELKLW